MTATTMIHIRVDEELKTQASETLAAMGLTVSDAVRVFLMRVVAEQAIPFDVRTPNAATQAAMREARAISAQRRARFADVDALIDDIEQKNTGD